MQIFLSELFSVYVFFNIVKLFNATAHPVADPDPTPPDLEINFNRSFDSFPHVLTEISNINRCGLKSDITAYFRGINVILFSITPDLDPDLIAYPDPNQHSQ